MKKLWLGVLAGVVLVGAGLLAYGAYWARPVKYPVFNDVPLPEGMTVADFNYVEDPLRAGILSGKQGTRYDDLLPYLPRETLRVKIIFARDVPYPDMRRAYTDLATAAHQTIVVEACKAQEGKKEYCSGSMEYAEPHSLWQVLLGQYPAD